jgi:hypothetical protein
MKNFMPLLLFSLAFIFLPASTNAGNSLTFVINESSTDDESVIIYPEGTTYEVVDAQGLQQKPDKVDEGAKFFTVDNELTIVVYPSYRPNKADRIPVKGDRLRVFETAQDAQRYGWAKNWQEGKIVLNHDDGGQYISRPYGMEKKYKQGAAMRKKIVLASEKRPGQYNLKLYFKNGLEFHYEDGEVTASLNGEGLIVEGKYLVHTKMGTAKISFNPKTGETWWVFTEKGKTE